MQVGGRYLLFLNVGYLDRVEGLAFGRFDLDPQHRISPVENVWLVHPGVKALNGLTVEEATIEMDRADEEFDRAVAEAREDPYGFGFECP